MPAQRAKDPRLLWTVAALVVAAGAVAVILLTGNGDGSVEGSAGEEDGLRFELRSTECGISSLNTASGAAATPENGTFCVIGLGLENVGDGQRKLDPSCQFMFDSTEARYTPREDIAALRETSGGVFQEGLGPFEVAPPNTALYYDVAQGTRISAVEFHASCGSEGVRIELPE